MCLKCNATSTHASHRACYSESPEKSHTHFLIVQF
nr:MAG TPA: hypothetical protein [Bacteriophage sp.]